MNKIKKLLKVGDTIYSASGGEPMKVISIGSSGFETEFGFFSYDEIRKLFFLTKRGYEQNREMKKARR